MKDPVKERTNERLSSDDDAARREASDIDRKTR